MSTPDSQIPCERHPEQRYTNFLCSKKESRGLCSECFEKEWQEISSLKAPVITIEKARMRASQKCQDARNKLQFQKERIEKKFAMDSNDDLVQAINSIRRYKERLIEKITTYCDKIESEFTKKYQKLSENKGNEYGPHLTNITCMISELDILHKQHEKEIGISLDTLIKIQKTPFKTINQEFEQKSKYLLKETEFGGIKLTPFDDDNRLEIESSILQQLKGWLSTTQEKKDDITWPEWQKKQPQIPKQFKVTVPDYYSVQTKRQFLHYFETGTNLLHVLDLKQPNEFVSIQFQGGIVPVNAQSIITPDGRCFLIGGTGPDQKKLNQLLEFNWTTRQMIQQQNMFIPRSSFACVYLDNAIYVIGGITKDNKQTSACERFLLQENYWENIAPLNKEVVNCSCTQFMGKEIYKFGGKCSNQGEMILNQYIEKYDPRQNKWSIVEQVQVTDDLKDTVFLLANMSCCQINSGQILIFGGKNLDGRASNQSYLFDINENVEEGEQPVTLVKGYDIHPLSQAGSFQNCQGTLFQNKLFVLQDQVINEKVDDSQRNLQIFDSKVKFHSNLFIIYQKETLENQGLEKREGQVLVQGKLIFD